MQEQVYKNFAVDNPLRNHARDLCVIDVKALETFDVAKLAGNGSRERVKTKVKCPTYQREFPKERADSRPQVKQIEILQPGNGLGNDGFESVTA